MSEWRNQEIKRPSAWVIREKATGRAIMETSNGRLADSLNTDKYEMVPLLLHLEELTK